VSRQDLDFLLTRFKEDLTEGYKSIIVKICLAQEILVDRACLCAILFFQIANNPVALMAILAKSFPPNETVSGGVFFSHVKVVCYLQFFL